MKKILVIPLNIILKWFYRDFDLKNPSYSKRDLLKYGIKQRFCFSDNRKVPWPVHPTSLVKCPEKIMRGTKAPGISVGCYLDGRNGIIFGPNVWTGPKVSIISMNHETDDYNQYRVTNPIKIGRDSWLAANCTILPGVELGEHTVVAAGAVVNRSFPEGNQVLAGVPAEVVKKLDLYKG